MEERKGVSGMKESKKTNGRRSWRFLMNLSNGGEPTGAMSRPSSPAARAFRWARLMDAAECLS